jgi:hypothetical protein
MRALLRTCPAGAARLRGAAATSGGGLLRLARPRGAAAAAAGSSGAPAPSAAAAEAAAAAFAAPDAPPGTRVGSQQQPAPLPRGPAVRGGRQTLDYTALAACVQELQAQWVPSKVEEVRAWGGASGRWGWRLPLPGHRAPPPKDPAPQIPQRPTPPPPPPPPPKKVVQPDAYTLSLRLRTPSAQGWLHLSWHPTAARLAVGGPPARGAASEAFSFADAAGQALKGLVLVGARTPARWERVAELAFGVRPGELPARLAFCEVQAAYSNLVLADGAGSVLAAAHQVGARQSSLRQVQQGRPYALPPVTSGVAPDAGEPLGAWRANVERAALLAAAPPQARGGDDGGSTKKGGRGGAAAAPRRPGVAAGAVRAYQGVSPSLMEELCGAAGVDPAADPRELPDAQWGALHSAWQGWLERVESGSFAATLDEAGGRWVACAFERARPLLGCSGPCFHPPS